MNNNCNCGNDNCCCNDLKNSTEKKEIELFGDLYNINKNIVAQNEIKLSKGTLNRKKETVKKFIDRTNNKYYMLLCHEKRDYTVFHNNDLSMETAKILIDECLVNRGEIRGIDITKTKDAIEIWLMIEDEAFVYYFFPYDMGIIEVGE